VLPVALRYHTATSLLAAQSGALLKPVPFDNPRCLNKGRLSVKVVNTSNVPRGNRDFCSDQENGMRVGQGLSLPTNRQLTTAGLELWVGPAAMAPRRSAIGLFP
jgi:hypothetical protein